MARFNKAKLLEDLDNMIDSREKANHFDRGNGHAHVVGKGEVISRDYAEWSILRFLRQSIDNGFIGTVE